MKNLLSFISIFFLLSACTKKDNLHPNENAIAKVGDVYLYPSDIKALELAATYEDTINTISYHREEWIKRQLLLAKAELNIDESSIEKQVQDYRESLIITEFQAKLLDNADFHLSEEELLTFYEETKNNFLIPTTKYKAKFVILPIQTPDENSIANTLNTGAMPQWLENYCIEHPSNCKLENDKWYSKEDLKTATNISSSLIYTTTTFKIYYTDDQKILIYQISETIKEGDPQPFEIVKDKVEDLATYQKKQDLLIEFTEKTYQTGKNNEAFEIYDF